MKENKKNRVLIAAAGSGKTTRLIDEALARSDSRILITTFTEANEVEIIKKFHERIGFVPLRVTVQTWYSFLLEHGARPYQGSVGMFGEKRIQGVQLVNGRSAERIPETQANHYMNNLRQLYTDKLAKFVLKCNTASDGRVSARLTGIYDEIFIDEVQDLAGYDLEVLDMLMDSPMSVLMVGDPRQGTYSTNNSPKYAKFQKSGVFKYFKELVKFRSDLEIDTGSLATSHRCNEPICALANSVFSEYSQARPGNFDVTGHDGVFLIERRHVAAYLLEHKRVMQLRDKKTVTTSGDADVMNFGASKGLTFDRVLIYPTQPYLRWLGDRTMRLAETSRAKLYVAITRARYSVGIVVDDGDAIAGIPVWLPPA